MVLFTKRLLAFVLFLVSSFGLYSQSVTPFVVGAAGDFFVNGQANASLSFTVAEMAMVETFSNQGYFLTQGFQQPELVLTEIEDEDFVYEFVVYPNPASEVLNIRYHLRHPGRMRLRFINLNGVEVIDAVESKYSGGKRLDQIVLDQVSQGMYFLQVSYEVPSKQIEHVSYYKINVIKH